MTHKEKGEEIDVEENPPPFDVAQRILDGRISNTHAIIGTEESPVMYFTGKGNFRDEISTTGYKLNRGRRPYHYKNIEAYLMGKHDNIVVDGMEADDALAVDQTNNAGNTIIISADKDLLQVEGWHYQFEYGKVASIGPLNVQGYGRIWIDRKILRGYGNKFFFAQCIMGDRTDSIVGIPKSGVVAAFRTLANTNTYEEGLEAVLEAYRGYYGDSGRAKMKENAQLLWMTRELDENGSPILWDF